eukprot:12595669-Alexandrium_andersonii.AAC.1
MDARGAEVSVRLAPPRNVLKRGDLVATAVRTSKGLPRAPPLDDLPGGLRADAPRRDSLLTVWQPGDTAVQCVNSCGVGARARLTRQAAIKA